MRMFCTVSFFDTVRVSVSFDTARVSVSFDTERVFVLILQDTRGCRFLNEQLRLAWVDGQDAVTVPSP